MVEGTSFLSVSSAGREIDNGRSREHYSKSRMRPQCKILMQILQNLFASAAKRAARRVFSY